jgi:hypothetical protein
MPKAARARVDPRRDREFLDEALGGEHVPVRASARSAEVRTGISGMKR